MTREGAIQIFQRGMERAGLPILEGKVEDELEDGIMVTARLKIPYDKMVEWDVDYVLNVEGRE